VSSGDVGYGESADGGPHAIAADGGSAVQAPRTADSANEVAVILLRVADDQQRTIDQDNPDIDARLRGIELSRHRLKVLHVRPQNHGLPKQRRLQQVMPAAPRQRPEIPGADLIPDIIPEVEEFLDAEARAAAEAETRTENGSG